ncbi:MAG: hypothetical protein WCO83_12395 [Alphaproteobacteria bacterium]
MAAQIISLFQKAPPPSRDWTRQETAEFYRVESALIQAGVQLESDRGVSDEGDPWFIFCRADNGEVFIHFARIDGFYVVDGVAFATPARGRDFALLVRGLLDNYPIAAARARGNSNIFVHPAALLIALVGAAFFHTSEAKAATSQVLDGKGEPRKSSLIVIPTPQAPVASPGTPLVPGEIDTSQAAAILLSAALALHNDVFVASVRPLEGVRILTQLEAASLRPGEALALNLFVGPADFPPPPQASVDKFTVSAATSMSLLVTQMPISGQVDIAPTKPAQVAKEAFITTPVDVVVTWSAEYAAAKPLFFPKISAEPLPSVEAMSIVISNATLAELVAKALPQVDRLPSSILDLITRGDHLNAALADNSLAPSDRSIATSPSADVVVAPPVVSLPEPQSTTEFQVVASVEATAPSSGNTSASQVDATPSKPSVAMPVTSSSTSEALKAYDAAISAAVTEFVSHVAHVDMILQGNQLVIYDRDILNPLSGRMDLDSVTITFADGSSLSLVGTVTDLSFFHWPG